MRLLFDKFLHLKVLTGPVSRFQDVIAHLSAFQIPSFLPMLSTEYSHRRISHAGLSLLGVEWLSLQHFGQEHAGHRDGPNAS